MHMRFSRMLVWSFFCFCVGLTQTSIAQDWELVMVDIDAPKATLVEIFAELEGETEYDFRYGDKVKNHPTHYSLVFDHTSLKRVLEDLAEQAGLKIVLRRSTISVVLKDAPAPLRASFPTYRTIRGRITDAGTGAPLQGARVMIKGRQTGVLSDEQGTFRIHTSSHATALLVSYLGYATTEVVLAGTSDLSVRMSPDFSDLDEVVVIGYGEQSRTRVTGAISKINSGEFSKYAASSFDQQLIGSLAGVQINQVNGQPGSDAQVVIRGLGTLTAGSNPLIVVDGVPLAEGSSVNSISPTTIESISVLKDAASAAIYGSRASNGVILITTKSGEAGPLGVSVDVLSGVQVRADQVELADAYAAAQFFTEARDWGYVSRDPANRSAADDEATRIAKGANKRELRLDYLEPYLAGEEGLTNTDWLDVIYRPAAMTNAKVSFSGGTESGEYFVAADYFNQQGLALGTDFERISGSVNVFCKLAY